MILLNQIKCKNCKDIIISHHTYDYKTCKCGGINIDGGKEYIRRGFKQKDDYIEMAVCCKDIVEFVGNIEKYHKILYWGTIENGEYKFNLLTSLGTSHLTAILETQEVNEYYLVAINFILRKRKYD